MDTMPLVNGLLNYIKEDHSYFAMPGHKMGRGFNSISLFDDILKADVTELPGLDNLHNPTGIIKEAEDKLTALYGSCKSYFLVNGSSSGNMIAIFSSFNEGDKVIVERSCHTSIFNGIIMRKLKPCYIYQNFNDKYNLGIEISEEEVLRTIRENPDSSGIILTSPNYYGVALNLEKIIIEAKKYNMTVIIDAAHGAHFIASSNFPISPIALGADIVVNSAHKTLPALTQSAYLHINNEKLIDKADFYFHSFNSTSPSYLLMASLDYSRYYLEEHKEEWEKLINRCEETRLKIDSLKGFHILDESELKNSKIDKTRFLINIEGTKAENVSNILRKNSIEIEYNDINNLILIFSPFNTDEELDNLYRVLKEIDMGRFKKNRKIKYNMSKPYAVMLPFEAINLESEKVPLSDSLGRIVKKSIIFYPPGSPCILHGERMDIDTLNMIRYYEENDIEIIGLNDDKIEVLLEED